MGDALDESTETDDDDLDRRPIQTKQLSRKKFIDDVARDDDTTQSSSDDGNQNGHPSTKSTALHQSRKVMRYSSSEGSEDAYNKFKNRKSGKRKKAAASTRKAKTVEKESGIGQKSRTSAKNGKSGAKPKQRQWGDETDEDDHLMEYTLPDFLQKRRAGFDKRTEKLKEAGLRLPPSYDDVLFSDDERLEELAERPDFPRVETSAPYKDKQMPKSLGLIPAPIAQWLRDYQVEGTEFLHCLFVYQTGGILGDDMGLGKTVQVIAFLTAAFGKTADERDAKRMRKMRRLGAGWYPRILVVCPGTLIENWKNEFSRWGWWHIGAYHGALKSETLDAAARGRLEVMITTYTTYRINKDAINMVEWDCVIADECHQIKGRRSEITQAMNEINALCRIGLTGTAIQNSYDELWTLLNWTNPGKFGPISTWQQSVSIPLKYGQSHDATVYQLAKARKTAKALVHNLLPQFFLRRMKTLIAHQLPKKVDRVVFCPLTETQADAYQNMIDSDVIRYIKESATDCECGSGKKAGWCCQQFLPDGGKWQTYVFPSIAYLQKLSNHLATLIPQSNDASEKQSKDLDILQVAVPDDWRRLYASRDSIMNYANPEFCGKWKILRKLLAFWQSNGDKVLVFSHSVRLLKMLQLLFQHTTYNVSYLDGAMKYEDRAKTVDDFNSDPDQFVFLISTKAGGVGLNITSANKVVVVDPNWNPSYDLQAQDRAYRIGQVRDVEVFRLVSAGTIEEIVYARQIYKQQQANIGYTASHERRYFKGIQENKDQKGEIFGLANLFTFQEERVVLRDIVNKTNVAESKAGVLIAGIDLGDDSQASSSHAVAGADDPFASAEEADRPSSSSQGREGEENAAMSQLAASIIDEAETAAGHTKSNKRKRPSDNTTSNAKKKSDPIQAILASAGVEYSHTNSEVIGSSTIEAKLSRQAQAAQDSTEFGRGGDRHVFARDTQQQSRQGSPLTTKAAHHHHRGAIKDEDDDDDLDPIMMKQSSSSSSSSDGDDGPDAERRRTVRSIPWRYRPPSPVRRRQLGEMARVFGFEGDITGFALVVEGWTQAQRRGCLERYYGMRRAELGVGGKKKSKNKESEKQAEAGGEGGPDRGNGKVKIDELDGEGDDDDAPTAAADGGNDDEDDIDDVNGKDPAATADVRECIAEASKHPTGMDLWEL